MTLTSQGFNDNNGVGSLGGPPGATTYSYVVSATHPVGQPWSFIGDPAYRGNGTMSLVWTITQAGTDGSLPAMQYSVDGGATYTTVQLGSGDTPQATINESGSINVALTGATGLIVNMIATGGTASPTATQWNLGLSINRNILETLQWDAQNPFNPLAYNPQRFDGITPNGSYPAQTLQALRYRVLMRLGFANQVASPPPGMAALVNEFITSAQAFLWRRYPPLQTRRMFRWKLEAGQRFYSLLDNDEDVLAGYHMDPNKQIEWVGIQDTRNVWYPVLQGIEPQLYTMIDKPWRPARYEIRGAIEVYPAPDQTYFLWMKANFGLLAFVADGDYCTIDSELLFLHALATAKAHYGQPDASSVESMANTYRGELVAATHQTGHYIPGTRVVPPAVRPTLNNFIGGGVS